MVAVAEAGVEVRVLARGASVELIVRGEIDLASIPLLQAHLEEAGARDTASIIVDLSGVRFMDLTGAHLLSEYKRFDSRLRLIGAPPQIRRLASLTEDPSFLPLD